MGGGSSRISPATKGCESRGKPADVVSWAFQNTKQWSSKKIFLDSDNAENSLSATETRDLVRRLIAGLKAKGIKRGDSVCVVSFNNVFYSALFLAIIGLGARFVAANPAYSETEFEHVFKTANVKLVIADRQVLRCVSKAASQAGLSDRAILAFDATTARPKSDTQESVCGSSTIKPWHHLLEHGRSNWIRLDANEAARSVAALLMTSGTTGMPKAAMISHEALIKQAEVINEGSSKRLENRRLICIPQFHAFTIPIAHLTPLRYGHSVYVMRRFDADAFLRAVSDFGISEVAVVPPIVHNLLSRIDSPTTRASLASLRHVYCAGAPLSPGPQAQFASLLHPEASFSQVWGMTEIGWITVMPFGEQDRTGSVGELLPGFQARVVRQSSGFEIEQDVGEESIGEICVRSPSMMRGYLANQSATDETIVDGWLRTGDLGFCKKGKWYIVDREKDIIKVRAWQVSPTEIETCLQQHPTVRDVAVVGITLDDSEGEIPRAYVVLESNFLDTGSANLTALTASLSQGPHVLPSLAIPPSNTDALRDELVNFVASRLAKFKHLAGGVEFVPAIPRNASGKILRKVLRHQSILESGSETDEASRTESSSVGDATTDSDSHSISSSSGDKLSTQPEHSVQLS